MPKLFTKLEHSLIFPHHRVTLGPAMHQHQANAKLKRKKNTLKLKLKTPTKERNQNTKLYYILGQYKV